jgi:putative flippase GtrA
MINWIRKTTKKINKKEGFCTFLRAQFSSSISSLTDFLISIVCVNLFGIFYGTATLIGNITGGLLNCFINYRWTFKAQGINIPSVLVKFVIVWLVSINLNTFGTVLFTEFMKEYIPVTIWPVLIVKNIFLMPKIIVSIFVGLVWNYNMHRLFVYRDRDYRKYLKKIRVNHNIKNGYGRF